ncbi:MAG TPA: hypothetical protein VFJ82_17840 [Longimicrobium sp.]|nr:hypothetical protein [Longimicrobium sp.]
MAGKADLVNGIVDRDPTAALLKFPYYDGWGEAAAATGEFPWQLSGGVADAASLSLDPFDGAGG